MFVSWSSSRTVSNHGSGFQMPYVDEFWATGAHVSWDGFSQSGSVPLTT